MEDVCDWKRWFDAFGKKTEAASDCARQTTKYWVHLSRFLYEVHVGLVGSLVG